MSVARVSNVALATVVLVGLLAACGSSESLSITEESMPTTSLASVSENSPTTPTVTLPATSDRNDDDASQRVADRSQAVTTTTVPVPPAPVAREDALYLSRFGVGSRVSVTNGGVISSLIDVFWLPQTDVMRRFRETDEVRSLIEMPIMSLLMCSVAKRAFSSVYASKEPAKLTKSCPYRVDTT